MNLPHPTRARARGIYCFVMAKGRHGLTLEQIYKLAEAQNFECPISGEKLIVRDGEIYDPSTGKRIPIDHDHNTGLIRGLLIQKVNWLIDQWDQNSYGKLSMPQEILDYKNNPPAFKAIGKINYI
jgi:hypothetical protein